jgi:hypothetical protein
MRVRLLRPICPLCKTSDYLIGPGKAMHAASLICRECRKFRGWASGGLIRALKGVQL